jgi:hypothetical protein
MKLPNFTGVVKVIKTFAVANRPEILLGVALVSTAGTAILAAQGGYKARRIVDIATIDAGQELTFQQKANLTWHCYIPATIAVSTAIGSITGLHLVHIKDKKAMATAGMAALEEAKEAAQQYRNELVGVADADKGREVDNKIHEKRADRDPDGVSRVMDSDGEIQELFLIRDPKSGRDIWSNKNRIEEAIVEVGNIVNGSSNASLNNFYEQAGFGRIDEADYLGWDAVLPAIRWTDENGLPYVGVRDDGRPYRSFKFRPEPEKLDNP